MYWFFLIGIWIDTEYIIYYLSIAVFSFELISQTQKRKDTQVAKKMNVCFTLKANDKSHSTKKEYQL